MDPEAGWWRDNRGWKVPYSQAPAVTEGKDVKIVLTVAHLNHKPEDCRRENLRALCQSCHLTYDAPYKAAERAKRRKAQQKEVQSDLFEEDDGNNE